MKAILFNLCLVGCWLAAAGCAGGAHSRQAQAHSFLEDKVTQGRIEAALRSRTNGLPDVQVSVTNGVAYLTGAVDSQEERLLATRTAQSVHRVKKIQDDLQVRGAPEPRKP